MTLENFLFNTYAGYIVEVLPISIIVTILFYYLRYSKDKKTTILKRIIDCAFVCYITMLFQLVWFLDIIKLIWHLILFSNDGGYTLKFFVFKYNLTPDFWTHFYDELMGNFLMFIPFGFLFSASQRNFDVKKTFISGIICTSVIEITQPIFGRIFDTSDLILNACGLLIGILLFITARWIYRKGKI